MFALCVVVGSAMQISRESESEMMAFCLSVSVVSAYIFIDLHLCDDELAEARTRIFTNLPIFIKAI